MITQINKENLKIKLPEFDYKGVWIAGGAIRDSIIGEIPSDIDVFGPNNLLDDFIQTNLKDYKLTFDNEFIKNYIKDKIKIQIIRRDIKTIEECLNNFDYTICMFAYDGNTVWAESNALLHLYQKRLVINKINPEFVVNTLERLQKYIKKGYTICSGGIKQIVDSIRIANQQQIDNSFLFYPATKTPRILRYD